MQTKELEDAKAAADQKLAHLHTQLDEMAASGQSQAAELTSAQTSIVSLQTELETLRAAAAQSHADLTIMQNAQTAQDTSAADREQQQLKQATFPLQWRRYMHAPGSCCHSICLQVHSLLQHKVNHCRKLQALLPILLQAVLTL